MFKLNGWGLRQSSTVCPTEEEKKVQILAMKIVRDVSKMFSTSHPIFCKNLLWHSHSMQADKAWFLSRICFFTKRLGVLTETPSFQGFRTGSLEIMSLGVFAQVFLVHTVPCVLTLFISLPPPPPPLGQKMHLFNFPPPPDHNRTF